MRNSFQLCVLLGLSVFCFSRSVQGLTQALSQSPSEKVSVKVGGALSTDVTKGNLIVCFDGTSNDDIIEKGRKSLRGKTYDEGPTNVLLMHQDYLSSKNQMWAYVLGVGTGKDSESKFANDNLVKGGLKEIFGAGVKSRTAAAYEFLSENYQPGVKFYIFGFSRGAFSARLLANKIKKQPIQGVSEIEMLGIWDTVGSLGVPLGKWQQANLGYDFAIGPNVKYCCHAVAIDEPLAMFRPTLATPPKNAASQLPSGTIEEVWFAGSHSDIGGGWPIGENDLSSFPLLFMLKRAQSKGLAINKQAYETLADSGTPDGSEKLHYREKKTDQGKFGEKVNEYDPRPVQVLKWDGKFDKVQPGGIPKIHSSVAQRIMLNEEYRPQNLLNDAMLQKLNELNQQSSAIRESEILKLLERKYKIISE